MERVIEEEKKIEMLRLRDRGLITKTNHPNSLKNTKSTRHNPDFTASIVLGDIRTLTYHCKYNNDHTYQCQCRGFGQFGDVSV